MYTLTRNLKNNPSWTDTEPITLSSKDEVQTWLKQALADERHLITHLDSDLPTEGSKVLVELGNEQIVVTVTAPEVVTSSSLSNTERFVNQWLAGEVIDPATAPTFISASGQMITAFHFTGSEPFVIARKSSFGVELNLTVGIFASSYVTNVVGDVVLAVMAQGSPCLYWIPFMLPESSGGHLATIPYNVPNISNRENVPSVLLGHTAKHRIRCAVWVETDKGDEDVNPNDIRVSPSGLPVRRIRGLELYDPRNLNPFTDMQLATNRFNHNTLLTAQYTLNDNIHNPAKAMANFTPNHEIAKQIAEGKITNVR